MSKLLDFLKAGPSAPPVVLLPDDRFFIRVLPVGTGVAPDAVATQVELALETISPFPPSQLYYGYYWVEGSEIALVFACYRKRFGSEQTASWSGSQIVLPSFAAVLGLEHKPATTVVIPSAEGLTAVHWGKSPVPDAVATRTLLPDATDEDRNRARDELVRSVGESAKTTVLTEPPAAGLSEDEKYYVFSAGDMNSQLVVSASSALDVRDKGDLQTMRAARGRDLLIWRLFMGCAAALVLLGLAEIGVVAARKYWFAAMDTVITKQKPTVASIQSANDLSLFIQSLTTKPVLPFEMISAIHPQKPGISGERVSFQTVAISKTATNELIVNLSAPTPADLEAYINSVRQQPGVADVKQGTTNAAGGRGNTMATVQINVVFKSGAIRPATGS